MHLSTIKHTNWRRVKYLAKQYSLRISFCWYSCGSFVHILSHLDKPHSFATKKDITHTHIVRDKYRVIHFVISKVNVTQTINPFKIFFSFHVNILCETLHHLNGIHWKCCKHWYFSGDFRPHIGRYLSNSTINSDFFGI